ncbi:MAG: hypothetical protein HWD92_00900 [Flavobacteriia bacterium]|nr:hypothetical protein [Flavobacteriia bacterium]
MRDILKNPLVISVFIGMVAIITGYRIFDFVDTYGCMLIHGDRWHTMEPLFTEANLWEGFAHQHGPHRLGLIHFIFKVNASLSHWNGRLDLFLQAAIYVISALLALRLKVKLFGKLRLFDVAIPLIFLTPHAAGTMFSNPYVHGLVPLFALALCYTYFVESDNRRIIALSLLSFVAAFTAFSLVLIPVIVFLAGQRMMKDRTTRKLKFALPSLIGVGSVAFIFFTNMPIPSNSSTGYSIAEKAEYTLALIGSFFILEPNEQAILYVVIGLVILFILTVYILNKSGFTLARPQDRTLLILLSSVVVFWMLNIYGRAHLAIGNATASRYIPIGMLFALGIYFILLKLESKIFRTIVLSGFVLLIVRMQIHTDHRIRPVAAESHAIQSFSQHLQDEEQYIEILNDESQLRTIHPHPERIDLNEKLEYLKENGLSVFREE